jgi:hypothetical protein
MVWERIKGDPTIQNFDLWSQGVSHEIGDGNGAVVKEEPKSEPKKMPETKPAGDKPAVHKPKNEPRQETIDEMLERIDVPVEEISVVAVSPTSSSNEKYDRLPNTEKSKVDQDIERVNEIFLMIEDLADRSMENRRPDIFLALFDEQQIEKIKHRFTVLGTGEDDDDL